jgi:hypothetical protein
VCLGVYFVRITLSFTYKKKKGVYFVRITLTFVKVLLNYIMISYFEIDIDH